MKCKKCKSKFFTCNIQLINFDGSLVVDSTTGLIDVEVTNYIAKYKRTSEWVCAKCKEVVNDIREISILDKNLTRLGK